MGEGLSAGDILALTKNSNSGDCNGMAGSYFWWVIIFFIIAGVFGGGNLFGNNNNGTEAAVLASAMNGNNSRAGLALGEEFITRDIFSTNQNVSDTGNQTQRDILESRYTNQLGLQQLQSSMQECCCSTKQQVMQNNYDNAIGQANITKDMLLGQANNQKDILLGNKDIQAQLAQCCCDIKTTVKDENAMTRDLIQQNYISELSDKLNVARSQISNFEQSQYLLNTIGRYNVVSVPPYGSYNPYFGNQYYGVSSIA